MIEVGQTMRFIPHWNKSEHDDAKAKKEKSVIGTVFYVNAAHRNFAVRYSSCGGMMLTETFKFSEIGKDIFYVRGGRNG